MATRRKTTHKQRPYQKRTPGESELSDLEDEDEEPEDDLRELRMTRPVTSPTVNRVLGLMRKLQGPRLKWIREKQPCLTEILARYPRFLDLSTDLVILIFVSVCLGKGTMYTLLHCFSTNFSSNQSFLCSS